MACEFVNAANHTLCVLFIEVCVCVCSRERACQLRAPLFIHPRFTGSSTHACFYLPVREFHNSFDSAFPIAAYSKSPVWLNVIVFWTCVVTFDAIVAGQDFFLYIYKS